MVRSFLRGNGWPRVAVGQPSHLDKVDVEHRVIDRWRPVTDDDVPDADVVVATWWETAPWVAALSPRKGSKVYLMQDYGAAGQPLEEVSRTWSLPMHIITVSGWLMDLIHQYRDVPVSLVPVGVDLQEFFAPERGKQARPTVGFVYCSIPQKGCDIVAAAIASARKRMRELRVLSFGSETPKPFMPLPPGTEFRFQVPDNALRGIYESCDAWLFGSRREGFGLPILEAMACHTPVIGTPAGAAPELLPDGGGILLKHEDSEGMAQAIEHVAALTDTEWRQRSNAACAMAARHSWDAAILKFESALAGIVNPSSTVVDVGRVQSAI